MRRTRSGEARRSICAPCCLPATLRRTRGLRERAWLNHATAHFRNPGMDRPLAPSVSRSRGCWRAAADGFRKWGSPCAGGQTPRPSRPAGKPPGKSFSKVADCLGYVGKCPIRELGMSTASAVARRIEWPRLRPGRVAGGYAMGWDFHSRTLALSMSLGLVLLSTAVLALCALVHDLISL